MKLKNIVAGCTSSIFTKLQISTIIVYFIVAKQINVINYVCKIMFIHCSDEVLAFR